jgi:Tol biopolymer transport system component
MADTDPDWSPQGGTIMFTRTSALRLRLRAYRVPDTGAGGAELLTNLSDDWSSTWARTEPTTPGRPAETKRASSGGPWDIYVHYAVHTAADPFPDNNAVNPAWSPNGARIAYETTFQGAVRRSVPMAPATAA